MSRITIKDIAQASGKSRSTVSRVINGAVDVDPETRRQIETIIEELGYIPSAAARNLSRNKSSIIAVVVPAVDNPFFGGILRGVIETLNDTEFIIMTFNTDDDFDEDMKALDVISKFQVEGLLYTPAVNYDDYKLKALQKRMRLINAPTVLMDRRIESLQNNGVYFNDTEAIYKSTNKLISLGHKSIGFISGEKGNYLPEIREKGYKEALKDNGIKFNQRFLRYGDYRYQKSYEEAKILLEMKDCPSAVITSNNITTNTFLKALSESKTKKREDIEIVGLDKIETLTIVDESFNYIERDPVRMGEISANLLLEKMRTSKGYDDSGGEVIILDTSVVIRKEKVR